MAFCSNCGNQQIDNAKFCISCGTPADGGAKAAVKKAGSVRKCPACGEGVLAMAAVCSACRHEFSNVQVSSALQSFFERLETIEDENKKLSFISGYPIPNSKEDILEFTIFAASHIKPVHGLIIIGVWYLRLATIGIIHFFWKGPQVFRFNKAWMTKIKQVQAKGKIAFLNDTKLLTLFLDIIADAEKVQKKSRMSLIISLACIIAIYTFAVIIALLQT